MPSMSLAAVPGVHPQGVHQCRLGALRPEQHSHRIASFKCHHTATAPQVEVTDEALEAGQVERRLVRVLRAAATLMGLDEEAHVVAAAETIGGQTCGALCPPPSSSGWGPARRAWSADGEPTSLIGGLRSSRDTASSWLE